MPITRELSSGQITVLLAPTSPVLADGLSWVLRQCPKIKAVTIAATPDELVVGLRAVDGAGPGSEPIVVFQPEFFGRIDPVRVAAGLSACNQIRSIALVGSAPARLHDEIVGVGGAGTFAMQRSSLELVHAVLEVARGRTLTYDAPMLSGAAERRASARGLTTREHEVLRLIVEGCTNRAIGERLYLSVHTARHHVQAVLEKLGAHSRVEAAAIAVREGLIDPDEIGGV